MRDRTLFIAEAGVNHNGSLALALELVDAAAASGADVVKFQTFRAEALATVDAAKAAYQVKNTGQADSQLAMLRALELSIDAHHAILARCRERGIRFMSTAFDSESLAFLGTLEMAAVKIPSGDITCGPLLLQAARLGRPLIVSTGMATMGEIERALAVIAFGLTAEREPTDPGEFLAAQLSPEGRAALRRSVTLLHCVTEYPAPAASVNLRAMATMRSTFGLPVGYSDHTAGIEVALAAVALGATVIEKHFTLDRSLDGPDHAASLEPAELAALVRGIRSVEVALGDGIKLPADIELANRAVARRSVVAARPIRAGERLTTDAMTSKRPGSGVSPMEYWDLLGTVARRDFAPDEPIEW